ncbi:mandelate racemase/muconate lactonizing enzyme family protein [Kitasatospora sp. NA04385]|uniref:mandelate racemase/muconate lactonizing enzyme family protein n=1 Tax=Kitasatospora sp. NA04385 TaxID=2742135 RepID=UPI00158FC649|nr:mandelate racemase/muconate lactonizing enzyme family protein [Kitasatospora sp. NA04385]QKW17740.1 mandelate racemase/muconate lactonizing enzyme family protein [Kitasatospora sp. NA04385]
MITDVRTLCGTRLHSREDQWVTDRYRSVKADVAVVVVETDDGVTGVGEACSYGNPRQIADWVRWYRDSLVGAELDDFSVVPRPTGTALEHAVGSAHDFAVAGIDCALWDARGRAAGKPVARLLNPDAATDPVDVYASGGVRYDWHDDPRTLIADVLGYVDAGYRTVKFRLGTAWHWDRITPARFLALYDEVRDAVDGRAALAVDANSRLSRAEARVLAEGLSERGALWLEEPIAKDDLAGYAELNQAVPLRISGGESFTTIEQFRPWIENGCFDIVQPDAGVCGITEVMRVGRIAAAAGLSLIPHSWHNGLMLMANAHAVAALPNAPMVEECMVQGPLRWGVVQGGSPVKDGRVSVLGSPGLGADVIDGLEEQYPYVEGHYSVEVYR